MADGKQSVRYNGRKDGDVRSTPDVVHVGGVELVRGEIIPGLTSDQVKTLNDDPYYGDFKFEINPKED